MIVSAQVFLWFNTLMVVGICLGWAIWDGRLFQRLWPVRRENHDEFFGSIMGLVMVVIGLVGIIHYHVTH